MENSTLPSAIPIVLQSPHDNANLQTNLSIILFAMGGGRPMRHYEHSETNLVWFWDAFAETTAPPYTALLLFE